MVRVEQRYGFVQQGGLHGCWRAVLNRSSCEDLQYRLAFGVTEGASGSRPSNAEPDRHRRYRRTQDRPLPIEGSTGHRQEIAGGHDANGGRQLGDGIHQGCSSESAFGSGHPNRAPTFFEHQ